jgi:hypothetical protein
LIEAANPDALIADKAFDADPFIATLTQREITPVIPPKANRKTQRLCDFALYRERNLVSASSINSSIFEPSPHATTNSPEIFSPQSSWLPLSSCSTEHRP